MISRELFVPTLQFWVVDVMKCCNRIAPSSKSYRIIDNNVEIWKKPIPIKPNLMVYLVLLCINYVQVKRKRGQILFEEEDIANHYWKSF